MVEGWLFRDGSVWRIYSDKSRFRFQAPIGRFFATARKHCESASAVETQGS